eukprot:CAMPEP_0113830954 /NCGR_PEP_ID=MMETSP0328-20130328/6600_1 /TAXON_ID=39455 /ORGANISM="Alexandrium minutum" /LENGTH=150 /DNA_ID=CAMNT_0000799093 /DNA_START=399 /DNA_END=852 /DNA_ORIENTATION=- /assembly_acc=CAM_ASM_000350
MSGLGAQDLANTAWAYSTLCYANRPLLAAIASASAIKKITAFEAQNLANTSWAFAKLSLCHHPLSEAIAAAALATIPELDSRALSNIAWAFAWLTEGHHPLMYALSAEARRRLELGAFEYTHGSLWSLWRSSVDDIGELVPRLRAGIQRA